MHLSLNGLPTLNPPHFLSPIAIRDLSPPAVMNARSLVGNAPIIPRRQRADDLLNDNSRVDDLSGGGGAALGHYPLCLHVSVLDPKTGRGSVCTQLAVSLGNLELWCVRLSAGMCVPCMCVCVCTSSRQPVWHLHLRSFYYVWEVFVNTCACEGMSGD